MRIFKGILALLGLTLSIVTHSQTVLVDSGSSWSYYDNEDEPADQDTLDWNDIIYASGLWSSGNAQLGYGDNDEATPINNSTETAYFRHQFTVAEPATFDGIELELLYDDGAIVYLNGSEIWRVNMPAGSVNYNTTSSAQSSENATITISLANTLLAGTNVLAVEVHQSSTSSSDISFDMKLVGNIPGSVAVNRGPYLQKGSNSSMTIRWRTDDPTESIIEYGTSLANLDQTYMNTTAKTEHIAELNNLGANTKYYYKIRNNNADLVPSSVDLYFQTHPDIGSEQPIRMWILGDPGTASTNQRAVRNAYYNYVGAGHTDGILFLGDNAYNDGTDLEYQNAVFSNMYEDKLQNSVAWSCLGNHDGHSADANSQTGPYFDIFTFPTAGESGGLASGTEAYYSFDYGNIHFIALESYETNRDVGGAMYNWALNDIQNTSQEWIVAFWHHPPYTKGSHDSDSESNLVDMRENFLPMLESNGVDLVLSGHSHSYERSFLINGHYGNSDSFDPGTHQVGVTGGGDGKSDGNGEYVKTFNGPEAGDGAVYITTGSAGKITNAPLDHEAMYYSVAQLGSCVLEVNGGNLDVKFIRETGAIDDYFTIVKQPDDCSVGSPCDDNDPCTENDAFDEDCFCVGIPAADSDGDGICDAEDSCPNLDNNLIGSPCDDGNPDTENDKYLANCTCQGIPVGSELTEVCVTISSGLDDVEEHGTNGGISSSSTDIELVYDDNRTGGSQKIGLRFNNIDVPQGAVVASAFIQFTVDESDTGVASLIIEGEDVDHSAAFATSAFNVSDRTTTSDSVLWSPPVWNAVGSSGPDQKSPDIGTIIQKIINRNGFNANNSISIIITGTGTRTAESFNGSPNSAAELCITYYSPCSDTDDDGVCDSADICPGFDDNIDLDNDGIPDGCDAVVFVANAVSHTFENTDFVISELEKGILLKNTVGDQYLLQVDSEGIPNLMLNNVLQASTYLPSGDLFIITPGKSIIFTRAAGSYAEISVVESGVLQTNNTTTLPAINVDLALGHLGLSEFGAGIVFRNSENMCYKMYVNEEGALAINPTLCPE